MQRVVNVYLHDHKIGMLRGQAGSLICLAEEEQQTYAAVVAAPKQQTELHKIGPNHIPIKFHDDTGGNGGGEGLDAVNGGKKGNGKGNGYGQRWHCGQFGHTRRECPDWLKLQCESGNAAALGGFGWSNGKGKGKKGKGKEGGKGKGWSGNGKSVGKFEGKSSEYRGSEDYQDAWGWDD